MIRHASLTPVETERCAVLLADALGLMAAGASAPGIDRVLRAAAELGTGDVVVPFHGAGWSPAGATAAASALVHGWDFDDTHDTAVVHTAAVAVPAALAAAQQRGADGRHAADGVVVGVQVLARLAQLVGPRPGVIRTAGLGAPAAAAAVAVTWGLDSVRVEHAMALSIGAALAPTTRQAVVDSSLAKRVQPGLAAQAGLYAAALAAQGIEGPQGWLTGQHGLAPGADAVAADLVSGPFAGAELAIKPYPACRYTHAALAAAEQLHREHGADLDRDRLVVHLPAGPAYAMVARPFVERGEPIIDAQFSVPWQVAALWCTGRYDVTTLAGPDVDDPRIGAAAREVRVEQDLPESARMSGARVELHRDGALLAVADAEMPGSPDSPLDRAAVDAKVRSCLAVAGLDQDAAAGRVWALVDALPSLTAAGLREQLDALVPSRQPVA